jgi:hypothetical protein
MAFRIRVDADESLSMTQRAARMQGAKTGLAVAAVHLQGQFARYPRRRKVAFSEILSRSDEKRKAQLRGFFKRLKKGLIEVPYRRGLSPSSSKLGQSWTTQASNGGFTQTVGTAAPYAPLVHSARKQTRFHKVTGWKTDEQIVKEQSSNLVRIVAQYIEQDI